MAERDAESNTGVKLSIASTIGKKEPATFPPPEPGSALAKFNEIVGAFGAYEICICFLMLLSGVTCAWQTMSFVFTGSDIRYACIDGNLTACDPDCPKIIFPSAKNNSNIIIEWHLICEDGIKNEISQSILLLGLMFGCILIGHLADQYGRRPCFLSSCMILLIFGCLISFTPWFWLYCFSKFFLGLACGGITICCLVFLVEYVEVSKRELMVVMFQFPYSVGYSTLPAFAYFLPNWRHFELAITSFGLVFISYFWLIPESPRWLLLMGYIDKCAEVLRRTSLNKGISFGELRDIIKAAHYDMVAQNILKDGKMFDLFKTQNMRKKTCILSFVWFVVYFMFYGLSDYVNYDIYDNLYLTFTIGAILNIVGTLAAYPVTKRVSRRRSLMFTFGVSAIFLFLVPLVPEKHRQLNVAILSIMVISVVSITFVILQLFTTELFPTVLRNSGMGLSFCIGRFGPVIAPYILDTAEIKYWFPAIVYATLSAISAFVILLLPETKGEKLPDTIEEGENFGKRTTTQRAQ